MKPVIKSVSVTVYKHSFSFFVFYESGRCRSYFSPVLYWENLLQYPLPFIRETRSFSALLSPLVAHGHIPQSVMKWILERHPVATYQDNPYTSHVFSFNFHDPDFYCIDETYGEQFNY